MIFKRTVLKLSTIILLVSLLLITVGLFATNLVLKKKYDKLDKNDQYWDYKTILSQPFKYLKVEGASLSHIEYEQNKTASVRIPDERNRDSVVKAYVKNDTLYLNITPTKLDKDDQNKITVRVFAPALLSVDGNNTEIELYNFKQNNLNVKLKGNANLIIKSMINNFNEFNVNLRDSSNISFQTSEEYKGTKDINFQHLKADMYNRSSLNIDNGYTNDLKLNMADSSFITLSGKSISRMNK